MKHALHKFKRAAKQHETCQFACNGWRWTEASRQQRNKLNMQLHAQIQRIQRFKGGSLNSITLHANWHWCLIIPHSLKCLTQRSRHLKESGLLRATHASGVSGPSWVTAGGAHGHPKPKRRPGNNGDTGGGGGKTAQKNTGAEGGGSSTSTTSSSPSLPLPLPPLPLPLPLPLRAQGQLPAT